MRLALADEVRRAAPVLVCVSTLPHGYDRVVRDRYPELAHLLATEYVPPRTTRLGVWYGRTDASQRPVRQVNAFFAA